MSYRSEDEVSDRLRAGEWFLRSGIQEASGGVSRYYLSDHRRNAPVSTEITAYSANALMRLYKETSDAQYFEAARKAAWYLVKAWDAESLAMPFECEAESIRYSYFFDCGIVVRGLLSVWRESGTPEFLATAVQCGNSMADDFFDRKQFGPILSLPDKHLLPYQNDKWSQSPGCYQLKAALAWKELAEVTRDERYEVKFRYLLQDSLASHNTFLPGAHDDLLIMDRLHAYLYFLEGLLPTIQESACADALRVGIQRVSGFVNELSSKFLRADVVAQLLRIRLFADQYGVVSLDARAAEQEASLLQTFQSHGNDVRLGGGFWFGERQGVFLPYMNPWATAFCYQAWGMWIERETQEERWQNLI